jgi:hypothetical protein
VRAHGTEGTSTRVVGGVEAVALELDGDREQEPLDRLAALFADLDWIVRHPLEALELMLAGYTTIFVSRQSRCTS